MVEVSTAGALQLLCSATQPAETRRIHLKHQGIRDDDEQYEIVTEMLDAFYRRVKKLEDEFASFLVVDTRTLLSKQGVPNLDLWHDEIHPNKKGFRKLAKYIRKCAQEVEMW